MFGLLFFHDKYWKSDEFSGYLGSLKSSKTINTKQRIAIDATRQAIRELNKETSKKEPNFGDKTPFKHMPELLSKCAYTGVELKYNVRNPMVTASTEHVLPRSWTSRNVDNDGNYLMVSSDSNSKRGNVPLIMFLKGWDA